MQIEKLPMTPVQMTASGYLPSELADDTPVKTFGEFLTDSLKETNRLQKESERQNALLAAGQVDDISSVMIAGQKAEIALQLTLQVRNKAVDAYQELMRMQV